MMEFPLDIFGSLVALLIVTAGSTLQGSVGFGLGLVCVPLLVLLDPVFIPGPLLLAALLLNILISHREIRSVDKGGIRWAIPGRIVGTVLGATLLTIVPRDNLSLLFGAMVLLAVLISLAGIHLSPTPMNILGAGTISGLMGTTSSVGGPPLALVYQRQEGPRIRGTLAIIFIIGAVISILALALIGRFGLKEIQAGVILFPGIAAGFLISSRTARILDQGLTRLAVLAASSISGMIVILLAIF
jgi:hypothetical protein